ncbi:MAG: FliM/FliN family flagellar motor switch protein [Planctomycetales bacterium]
MDSIDALAATCRDHAGRLAECLRFGGAGRLRLEVGATLAWDAASLPEALDRAGAALTTGTADASCLWLVPFDALPAGWTGLPDGERDARLLEAVAALDEALASVTGAPGDVQAREAERLSAVLEAAGPHAAAGLIELLLFDAEAVDGERGGVARGRVFVAGPVGRSEDRLGADEVHAALRAGFERFERDHDVSGNGNGSSPDRIHDLPPFRGAAPERTPALPPSAGRLMKLPVTVVVQLAEKKIEMRQLLLMSVGTLIMFDKACEDPLGLYVNNRLYCQGEAVKIGEKFGLKIDQVGATPKREERILYG